MVVLCIPMLAQVFGNLVDNASKYAPSAGDIGLSVAVHGTSVCLRVLDTRFVGA
jgi:signal transduction histidine kinase